VVIDRLHDCLRQLATRDFPSDLHYDAGDVVRLIERTLSWEAYVWLAFDELCLAGAASPQPPLERQLDVLVAAVHLTRDRGNDEERGNRSRG
jgi:uncharacterized membrane protein